MVQCYERDFKAQDGARVRCYHRSGAPSASFSGAAAAHELGKEHVQAQHAWPNSCLPSAPCNFFDEKGVPAPTVLQTGAYQEGGLTADVSHVNLFEGDWPLSPRAHQASMRGAKGSLQVGADTDDSVFACLMSTL
jgi:hypothetical protein